MQFKSIVAILGAAAILIQAAPIPATGADILGYCSVFPLEYTSICSEYWDKASIDCGLEAGSVASSGKIPEEYEACFVEIFSRYKAHAQDSTEAKRSLSGDLKPVLRATQPLVDGVDNGFQEAGNIGANTVNAAGDAAGGTVNGVGKIVGGTTVGIGGAANQVPAATYHTVKNVESNGVFGSVGSVISGNGDDGDGF